MSNILKTCPLRGNTEHVFVDTKISMLMPGWIPGIPGWHTDGVPRDDRGGVRKGRPSMKLQEQLHTKGASPTFHLMLVGISNLTRFISEPLGVPLANGENRRLYNELTDFIEREFIPTANLDTAYVPYETQQWLTWDWWNIHAATPAASRGWRMLVRVTESDVPPANKETEQIVRKQTLVYVPTNYGW